MMKTVFPRLAIGILCMLLVTGHPLPEDPESAIASQESAQEIADAVKQVSADSPASQDAVEAAAETAAAAAPDAAGGASDAAAAAAVGAASGAHGAPVVASVGAGAADAALPHVSGAVSGPRYEHESHQQAARHEAFSEAAQGAQQGSQAAEAGEAFKKVEGFENQGGFRKQEGFSEKSSNRYGSGFFQGSEGQNEFNRGDQHSFGVAGYGAHQAAGVVGSPNYQELLKVGFVP
uniref:Glycine rich superfamily member n=1 Tax=Rhipicephalus appendiculatus TaxID=34631 RepID=A0A131YPH9_RHIAP